MPDIDYYKLFSLILVHMLAVASPGPDFMIVVKQSIQNGRKSGILTSTGIGFGLFLHCIFALTVLTSILHFFPSYLIWMKIISASYLLYMAYGCFQTKVQKDELPTEEKTQKAFLIGLLTNGTNPKVIIYVSVIFTNIAGQYPVYILFIFSFYLALQTIAWFALVTYFFCQSKTRQVYLNYQRTIDILMGLLLILITIRLLLSTMD